MGVAHDVGAIIKSSKRHKLNGSSKFHEPNNDTHTDLWVLLMMSVLSSKHHKHIESSFRVIKTSRTWWLAYMSVSLSFFLSLSLSLHELNDLPTCASLSVLSSICHELTESSACRSHSLILRAYWLAYMYIHTHVYMSHQNVTNLMTCLHVTNQTIMFTQICAWGTWPHRWVIRTSRI